ncbi:hypothetical protein [Desulfobotulus mexicanus]|uniref:Uncharacterized protein n=1 Tax=Desulfobotulus mexicanus TaxID=2586642 RepID=A0A5Q4VBL0_9BACT|nr:hypothetical protein [Desulfobotulus mexicanus]TYT74935.1 hypothetical protein FIM25_07370 [Desulfobotulus mexicanus]
MEVTLNLNEDLVKWYQKRSANFGLDLDDMVDFVLNAYAKKTDPKKTAAIPSRARAAAGMSEEEALRYVHFPLEKRLWHGARELAEKTEMDATEFLTRVIVDFLEGQKA